MDLRHLEYLEAVARTGSFTAAARELHVVQPAVSQQIMRLERELDAVLIDRATRQPTEIGERLVARARRIFAELEAARGEVAEMVGLEKGTVRAGAIHWLEPLDISALLSEFSSRYPGISVDLREYDASEMFAMVRDGRMDLVFSNISPGDETPHGFQRQHIFSEPLVVGVSPSHRLARRKSVRLEELAGEPFVAFRPGAAFRDTVDRALEGLGFVPEVRFESSDLAVVRRLAAAGLGVALMPKSLSEAPGPEIVALRVSPKPPVRTVALTWRADITPSPASRAFLEVTLDWIEGANHPDPASQVSRPTPHE